MTPNALRLLKKKKCKRPPSEGWSAHICVTIPINWNCTSVVFMCSTFTCILCLHAIAGPGTVLKRVKITHTGSWCWALTCSYNTLCPTPNCYCPPKCELSGVNSCIAKASVKGSCHLQPFLWFRWCASCHHWWVTTSFTTAHWCTHPITVAGQWLNPLGGKCDLYHRWLALVPVGDRSSLRLPFMNVITMCCQDICVLNETLFSSAYICKEMSFYSPFGHIIL